ncbi:MAG TPA: ABC transporter permease, partial [Chitinophagales bacterium]|nr:ABC transporter permease [Chitinophagales bacterium]
MFDFDKWEEIFATIARNKLRTALTALGVFWGIMMLVLLLGSGNGLKNGVENNFKGYAVNSIYIWPQKTTKPHRGLKPGRFYMFRNGDYEALKAQVPEVGIIAPRIQLGGWRDANNISRKNKKGNFQVMGDYPEYRQIEALEILKGRYLNNNDLAEKRKVCILGEQVVKELFLPDENPMGDYIKIKGVFFQVVGVYKTLKTQGEEADRDRRTIFIPFTTFQQAFNMGDKLGWFALTSAPGISAEKTEKKVKQLLSTRHNISQDDTRAIGSFNAEREAKRFMGLFTGIRIFIWLVGLGTLLAGAIGVSNIMLIVVTERTKEIGIRKAMGATPLSIIAMLLQESVFLTFMAGWLGLTAGVALLESVSFMMTKTGNDTGFFLSPGIDFGVAIQATVILI